MINRYSFRLIPVTDCFCSFEIFVRNIANGITQNNTDFIIILKSYLLDNNISEIFNKFLIFGFMHFM